MVNVNKLRGVIAERGSTQKAVAECIGCSPVTFGRKMNKGVFNTDEIEKMVDFLGIENPVEIFFNRKCT